MWQCPRRHKVNKGEKYKHTRPLNYQNIKNMILKFTCTNPRIVSAEKDVVETFTSQLLITLFPEPTDLYIYYRVSPSLTDIDVYRWCKYGFMFTCDFILLWVSILKCAITVVSVLVILGTLESQRFCRILEKTLDIICTHLERAHTGPCKLQHWSSAQSACQGLFEPSASSVPAVSDTAKCASRAACIHMRFQRCFEV